MQPIQIAGTGIPMSVLDEVLERIYSEPRICGREGCGTDIRHMRTNTQFCSAHCRKLAHRGRDTLADGASEKASQATP
jgi:hypothetical protein